MMSQAATNKNIHVKHSDLPLSCPPKGEETSGSHPKIYLKLNDNGEAFCQYCGAKYILESN